MFLLKIFGIMDIYSALVMLLVQADVVHWKLILTATGYLFFKGYLFKGEIGSMIDTGIGIYHIIMVFLPIPIVTYLLAGYLIVKGVQSLF